MNAFEDTFNHTSTEWAPGYIIPADNSGASKAVKAFEFCAACTFALG